MAELALIQPQVDASDEALAAAAVRGDRNAYACLMHRHRPTAIALAASMLGNRDDAEDIVQDAFVRAYLALPRFHAGARWAPWLMRIVQNGCRDMIRRRRVRRLEEPRPNLADSAGSPEDCVLAIEGRSILAERVGRLPEKFRVPLRMRYVHQRTYREIAEALGIPESTVMGRLAGALRILRRQVGGMDL